MYHWRFISFFTPFTSSQWLKAFNSTYATSRCMNHLELAQKMMLSWYIPYYLNIHPPVHLFACGTVDLQALYFTHSRFYKTTSASSRKSSSSSETTCVIIQPNPALAFLNLDSERFLMNSRIVVTHILFARIMIVRHWRSQLAPTPSEAFNLVKTSYLSEKALSFSSASYTTCVICCNAANLC